MSWKAAREILGEIWEGAVDQLLFRGPSPEHRLAEGMAEQRARARRRVRVVGDVMGVAALHDRVIVEAERAQLAEHLMPMLADVGLSATVDELVAHWTKIRDGLANDDDVRAWVQSRTEALGDKALRRVFDAVVAVVAMPSAPPADDPFRRASASSPAATIELFGQALGVDPGEIAAAMRGASRPT